MHIFRNAHNNLSFTQSENPAFSLMMSGLGIGRCELPKLEPEGHLSTRMLLLGFPHHTINAFIVAT